MLTTLALLGLLVSSANETTTFPRRPRVVLTGPLQEVTATATIPIAFHGEWQRESDECGKRDWGMLLISADGVVGKESRFVPAKVIDQSSRSIVLQGDLLAFGIRQRFLDARNELVLNEYGDRLWVGDSNVYSRCPAAAKPNP